MTSGSQPTAEGLSGPRVTQFSIFLSNRVGALLDVVRVLNERNIHVLAISVQDSADTAIVRIVVSDPESVQQMFLEHAIAFSICDLVVVELKEGANDLGHALSALLTAEINIHHSYPLMNRPSGLPLLALYLDDAEIGGESLSKSGYKVLSQGDLSR